MKLEILIDIPATLQTANGDIDFERALNCELECTLTPSLADTLESIDLVDMTDEQGASHGWDSDGERIAISEAKAWLARKIESGEIALPAYEPDCFAIAKEHAENN